MGLAYKFPKFYDFIVNTFLKNVPGTFVPDDFADKLMLDRLKPGSIILDLACGTGSLTLWCAKKRMDCQFVGLDIAADMLNSATQNAQAQGLKNVVFLNKSALDLAASDFAFDEALSKRTDTPLDMVLCSHGFSAMKNYAAIFRHTASLLTPGGSYVVVDLYYPKRTPITLLATYTIDGPIFGANQFRQPFILLQKELTDFKMTEKSVIDFGFLPSTYYVAWGTKPEKGSRL